MWQSANKGLARAAEAERAAAESQKAIAEAQSSARADEQVLERSLNLRELAPSSLTALCIKHKKLQRSCKDRQSS